MILLPDGESLPFRWGHAKNLIIAEIVNQAYTYIAVTAVLTNDLILHNIDMIARSSIAGVACLTLLSGFEQIFCLAAAAPAPRRAVARPKHYLPRHVKRIVTNGTQSHSSTSEVEEDNLKSEAPTTTLHPISSPPLASSLESLLSSLIPAVVEEGVAFVQTTPGVLSVSTHSTGHSTYVVDSASVSRLTASHGISTSVVTPSTTPLFSSVPSSNTPLPTVHSAPSVAANLGDNIETASSDRNEIRPNSRTSDGISPESAPATTVSPRTTRSSDSDVSVTAPPTILPTNSGILGPNRNSLGDLHLTRSTAAVQLIDEISGHLNNATASLNTLPAESNADGLAKPVESPASSRGERTFTPTRSSDESAPSVTEKDRPTHRTQTPDSATDVSFALFGANTILFPSSDSVLSASRTSSPISVVESAAQEQHTSANISREATITTSDNFPRKTNTPDVSGLLFSGLSIVESAGVKITSALSGILPEETRTIESEHLAPISNPVSASIATTAPEKTKTADLLNTPDDDGPGLDEIVSRGQTTLTGATASLTAVIPDSTSNVGGSVTRLDNGDSIKTGISASVTAQPTITSSGGGIFPIPVINSGPTETAKPLSSDIPTPDDVASSLVGPGSSIGPNLPEKSITAKLSTSVVPEPNDIASDLSKASVAVPLTTPVASEVPTAGLSESVRLFSSPSAYVSLPQFSDVPRLGPSSTDGSRTTDLAATKTDNVGLPIIAEPSPLQSDRSILASLGSSITSAEEPVTKTLGNLPITNLPDSGTLSTDSSKETDVNSGTSSSTVDQNGAPVLSTSVIDISLSSITPGSALPPDAFTQEPPLTSNGGPVLLPSITKSIPQISISVTDLPSLVEPSRTDETGSSTGQASIGSPILVPEITDSLPLIAPSRTPQTDAAPAKATQSTEGLPDVVPGISDSLPTITVASPSAPTDLVAEKPATTSDLRGSLSVSVSSVTESLPVVAPSLAPPQASASISGAPGEDRPSLTLPASIPAISSPASTTAAVPPVVVSPTLSVPPVLASPSASASLPVGSDAFTAVPPVVTPGPSTSGDVPVAASIAITASNDHASSNQLTVTPSVNSGIGLPVIVPQASQSADQVPIKSNSLTTLGFNIPATSAAPSIPISVSLPIPSNTATDLFLSSDSGIGVPITASPVLPLTTEGPAKLDSTSLPVIIPLPSDTSNTSPLISVDQSGLPIPATSKEAEAPASTGGVPPVTILPSSGSVASVTDTSAPASTGSQLLPTATAGEAVVTGGSSLAPILVGISDILTASPSNPGVSIYSSPPGRVSSSATQSNGIVGEPSGVSPSAGAIPTGTPAGAVSATSVESVPPNPVVASDYSSALSKAEGSGVSAGQAPLVTPLQTSNGHSATAAQPSGASDGLAPIATPSGSVESTGVAAVLSGAASKTVGTGARPSDAVISSLPSSVPNDVGTTVPDSTAKQLVPSAAASLPATITPPVKGIPYSAYSQPGSHAAVPTGTDGLTAQVVGSSIIADPTASMPTAPADFPTGIPSTIPRIIVPPDGRLLPAPNNTTLCQIGFLFPLNYNFVLANPESQRQIFKYLPKGISDGLDIPENNVTMQTLRAYDTTVDLGYITTLALFFIPSQQMDTLQLDLHSPQHPIYHNPNPSVLTMMSMINPAIPIKGDNSLGTSAAPGPGNDDTSTTSDQNPANEGGPISGVNNSSPVRAKSVGIAAGVVCGAAAYGAAMFFVARRYRKRKQSHRRSPSMLNSPVLSGTSHDYMGISNNAMMSGGRGEGGRSLTPHNGYHYERNSRGSRGSGNSGSTGRQQISAPVMAENSLGWN